MADPLDISVPDARKVVLDISHHRGWIEPDLRARTSPEILEILARVRQELGDTVETIARDIYSRKSRFVLELIQNAEDCQFNRTEDVPTLSFDVSPNQIIFESNEDGFTENDVRQICRTGQSWKKQSRGYVGEKGIGFKSVFQVASKVDIQSNSFSFSFEYHGGVSSEDKLGIITPIPEDDPVPLDERPLTRMTLTPNNTPYEELISYFNINISWLLFLSKIKAICITIHRPHEGITTTTTFKKSEIVAAHQISLRKTSVTTSQEDEGVTEDKPSELLHYIFRALVAGLPDDPARPGMNDCEVVLAFPVNNDNVPIQPTSHDVFAFLPVSTVGFNFLIQADFILQASREEIMFDSPWNRAILAHIADTFCSAILDFCGKKSSRLRFDWVKYLPVEESMRSNPFWESLSSKIIQQLSTKAILCLNGTSELRTPETLRTLPSTYLDKRGSPLFMDRPERHRKYLSLEYAPKDIATLKQTFKIRDIEDLALCHRIKQDLDSPHSRMKTEGSTFEPQAHKTDWHHRAANLILSILKRSTGTDTGIDRMIKETMPLIPLVDGRWICASGNEFELYFPAETGPAVPQDIMVTIDPNSIRNASRKILFRELGAIECRSEVVIDDVFDAYSRSREGLLNLACSKAHLSYLYWHHKNHHDIRLSNLWIYDRLENKVIPRRKVVYLPGNDEYGPEELFRSVLYNKRQVPECQVAFLHDDYMKLFDPDVQRNGLSWLDWLKSVIGVRGIPHLKFPAGSLATEFRHILQYRPEKIVGTLKRHWSTYGIQMTPTIEDEISNAMVACRGAPPTILRRTYFPLPLLETSVRSLGVIRGFPFLELPISANRDVLPEDWRFLERYKVRFHIDLSFYLDILRQHEIRTQKLFWSEEARLDILNTYELIADHYSESNKNSLVEAFDADDLILHPRSFEPTSRGPTWLGIDSCIWKGPEDLLDETPLAIVSLYRTNRKITQLFHNILGIQNADFSHYKRALSKLKANPTVEIADRVLKLYKLFTRTHIRENDWNTIRENFENEAMIFVPSTSTWFPPSKCLWSSPVSIEGKAVIGGDYPAELREFFLVRLKISPVSLATLVEGLQSLGKHTSSIASVKQTILAINAMNPKPVHLECLEGCNILPIRGPSLEEDAFLTHSQDDFAINDREKLAKMFNGHVKFLDFSLEEVCHLEPFLQALGLSKNFLSRLCTEKTDCDDDGTLEDTLTAKFKSRAYYLLRCAASNRSPLTTATPQVLLNRLLGTSIMKTNSISTRYKLHHTNGIVTESVSENTGYVHVRLHNDSFRIFVPSDKKSREICYRRHLPEALAKLFQIEPAAREILSNVLNSTLAIMDDLLEEAGIGQVPGTELPAQRCVDETDEPDEPDEPDEIIAEEAVTRGEPSLTHFASGSDGVETENSESDSIPPSPIYTPPQSSESARRARDSTPQGIPRREAYNNLNAYGELLSHVIRIADRTELPRCNALAHPSIGQNFPGFNRADAFGIRSQNQINHDVKIGAAGELFVFEVLTKVLPGVFNRGNWRSTIRKEATIHPKYSDMAAWNSHETSDIVYEDTTSQLTQILIRLGYLEDEWRGAKPEYLIEVKTTTGDYSDRLFMSKNQYRMMQEMALTPGRTAERIYAIFRVFDMGKESLALKIYVDPESHRQRSTLWFKAEKWSVKPNIY